MDGGELFSRIQDRGDQAFTERGEERTSLDAQYKLKDDVWKAAMITNKVYNELKPSEIKIPSSLNH